MKDLLKKFKKLYWLALIPVLTGCGGGGGGLAALGLGSLFGVGGGGSVSSLLGGVGPLALGPSAGAIPTLSNPEPASMILVGTGVAAMAYFKKRG